ncbi:hypothetical protein D1007_12931 [Hordeum vulgare]|nr:hypothetical protein D1007_12931 [Hordeum vulgare]
MDALSLINVSGEEDDFLLDLASPPPRPAPGRRRRISSSSSRAGRRSLGAGPGAGTVPKKSKPKGIVNLCKSLAWDKAFLTSEDTLALMPLFGNAPIHF